MASDPTSEELQARVRHLEARVQELLGRREVRPSPEGGEVPAPAPLPGRDAIRVAGTDIAWDTQRGTCTFDRLPVAMLWIDTTLAGLMAGLQAMVGAERFGLALQSEGRKSVEADWQVIARYREFEAGFRGIAAIAAVAGWGEWRLVSIDEGSRLCRFRVWSSWEGRYQKALGVCWGSGMLAGKLAGYCSRLFGTNCWADQTAFLARGDAYDEFSVGPSDRTVEEEIARLLLTDRATRADMAVALQRLRQESAERQRAEERVRLLSQPLESILDSANVWVEMRDEDGRVLIWNQAAAELSGYARDEVLGRADIWARLHPDPESRPTVIGALDDEGSMTGVETTIRRKDGTARVVAWYARSLPATAGQSRGLLVLGLDVTERRAADRALRESEARFRDLVASSSDWIWEVDGAGRYTFAAGRVEEILGHDTAALLGKTPFDFMLPAEAARVRVELERAAAAREPLRDLETWNLTRTGDLVCLSTSGVPILDGQGRLLGYRGVDKDITGRKRAEQVLRESEDKYRALVETTDTGYVILDAEGRVLDANSRYVQLTGHATLPDILGRKVTDWTADHDRERNAREVGLCLARGTVRNLEIDYVDGEGRLTPIEINATVVRPEAGLRIVTLCRDITERKQAELALFEEKERALVTLHSIGDAVITTDARGVTAYLNPVAEALTGWTTAEARGRPLSEVFHVVGEQTRQPAPDPVARCLEEGKVVGLANHSILIRRDGKEYNVDDSAAPIRGRDGRVLGVVLVFHDVTEHRQLARQAEYDATHDALTGQVNRAEFERRLGQALTSAREHGARHALCYLDLDQFKVVNDTAGHAAGDQLLRQVSTIMAGAFRERDTLARIGGDEFGLLLAACPLSRAQRIAQTLVDKIREHRFVWEGRRYPIGVSIGLVPITAETQGTAQVLAQADVACYTAKELGRNRVHAYEPEDSETVLRHGAILRAAGLRDALEKGLFRLHYQPIVSLAASDRRPVRYEALLRLADKGSPAKEPELLPPSAFIPAAERFGLMGALDRWVIAAAFGDLAGGEGTTGAGIAINLSGNSLCDETLFDFIETQFVDHALPPERVCFEITETAAIQNLGRAVELMGALKRRGSQLALDDFGSGLSSFRYLKTLPVDYLKIDGSFVKDMIENSSDAALLAAINEMSHTLGIRTVAEYAHSEAIVERLRDLGVDYAQGYCIGEPAPWKADPAP